jgi:pimeloyl-ACP methyl ester carboxylesterase
VKVLGAHSTAGGRLSTAKMRGSRSWRVGKRLRGDQRANKGIDTRYTNEAADRLGEFDKPALIVWSRDDRFFKPAHAERLAQDLPNARLEWIENARSFAPEEEPVPLAELSANFAREQSARASA